MGRARKFDYQAAIQHNLVAASDALTLDELLERSGLEVDRSTLFRHLTALIQQGRVERLGKARASRYRPLGVVGKSENQVQPEMPPPTAQSAPPVLDRSFPNPTSLQAPNTPQESGAAAQLERPAVVPGAVEVDDQAGAEDAADAPVSVDSVFPKSDFEESELGLPECGDLEPAETRSAAVPAPDFSLAIRKGVRIVVREWKRCDRRNLQIYLSLLVEPEYVDALTVTVEQELAGLHEGNLEKFGLTPAELSEFDPTPRNMATND